MSDVITPTAPKKTYKSKHKPTWCPGCGDFGVLAALDKALAAYGCPEHDLCIVAGIGCSSRFPFFMDTYGVHTAHGRALAVATGLKAARPDLTVIATGGDGDALAIGGNHFFHTMRRNVDMTYILMDNQIYGMTKGQAAPTSHLAMQTKSTPYGSFEAPINPVWAALTMGASYVAQGASHEYKQLTELILNGIRHHGMAFINVLSPCVTFNQDMNKDYVVERAFMLEPDYDPTDYAAALKVVHENEDRFPLGLLYQREGRPSFEDGVASIRARIGTNASSLDLRSIAADYM